MPPFDAATFDDVLLEAGQLYLQCTRLLTIGGIGFDPNYVFDKLTYDGDLYPVAGLDEIIGDRPTLTAKVKAFTGDVLTALHPGATITDELVTPPAALTRLTEGALVAGLAAIWPRIGGGYLRVRFPLALCTKHKTTSKQGDEVVADVEFEARASAAGQPRFYLDRLTDSPYPCQAWASLTGWTLVQTIDDVPTSAVGTFALASGLLAIHVNLNAGIALIGLAKLWRTHTYTGLTPGADYDISTFVTVSSGSVAPGNQFGLTAIGGLSTQAAAAGTGGLCAVTVDADDDGEIDVILGMEANGLGQPVLDATFTAPLVVAH